MEKLDYLIKYLLEENKDIDLKEMPNTIKEKKNLYRSLCNIRDAKDISNEYLAIEDKFLQDELKQKEITDIKNIKSINKTIENCNIENQDKICLCKGDITALKIEAIVNAANSQGLGCFVPCHKCIDNQIHTFAGIRLRLECNEIMNKKNYRLETGKAFLTKAYNLPSKYIIHTVGPIVYEKVTTKEEIQLLKTYTSSLELAKKNDIREIAFPCISTGEFRFPKEIAVKYAFLAVQDFLKDNKDSFDKIIFNVYSEEDYEIYERFIKQNSRNQKNNR